MTSLTLFYDGRCPLCVAEMRRLAELDTGARLAFEDINDADFSVRHPHIDIVAANQVLHGQTNTGEMLYGLDVSCQAWKAVGRHRWMAILRWPLIRGLADAGYRLFARHRYRISRYLTGRPRCTGYCENLPRRDK